MLYQGIRFLVVSAFDLGPDAVPIRYVLIPAGVLGVVGFIYNLFQ